MFLLKLNEKIAVCKGREGHSHATVIIIKRKIACVHELFGQPW